MATLLIYTPPSSVIVHTTQADFVDRDTFGTTIHLVQGDDKLPVVEVELYKNGLPYSVPAGASGNIRWKKPGPDRHFVYNPLLGVSESRTSVYFEVTSQMVSTPGHVHATVELIVDTDVSNSEPLPVIVDRNPIQEWDLIANSTSETNSILEYVEQAADSAEKAKASETAAATSEKNAKASQTAAASSASSASTSATNAKASETAAKNSQTAAAGSASAAASSAETAEEAKTAAAESASAAAKSATAASTSETNAKKSETAAGTSATNAKASETAAKNSQTAAAGSATAAAASAETAQTSATSASSSASSAQTSASSASTSASNAKKSETAAAGSATAAAASAEAAKASEDDVATNAAAAQESQEAAAASATAASTSEKNAKASETAAKNSQTAAATSATNAKTSETAAKTAQTAAETSASSASSSATAASNSAKSADTYAKQSKSYAVGDAGGVRADEDVDNSKYYYEQAKRISQGLQGSLIPMGTVKFSELSSQIKQAGYMYNISNAFMTDATFKEGSGHSYPAGTNVYYTADGYWDALAGIQVTGVKGHIEGSYRVGNVDITAQNVGALPLTGGTLTGRTIGTVSNAHYNTATTYTTGYYKISINAYTNWMMSFILRLYQSYQVYDVLISGYNYGRISEGANWYSPQAIILGSTSPLNVIFGYDSAFHSWIAVPAAAYTGIDIFNTSIGYTADRISDLGNLFTIEYVEELTGTSEFTVHAYPTLNTNSSLDAGKVISGILPIARGGTGNATGTAQYVAIHNIPNNADLDTYHTAGLYRCVYNGNSATVQNKPPIGDIAFSMVVIKTGNDDTTTTTQLLVTYQPDSHEIYHRNGYQDRWGAWARLYTTANPPTAADVGALAATAKATSAATSDKVAHTLTFTGGSTQTFNGSTDVSVAIPTVSYPVTSVNSKTGAVTLNASDVGALASTGTAANASKVAHTLTFIGGSTQTFNGSTDVSVAIPTTLPANGGTATSCTGNAGTATKLAASRNIAISGAVTGTATAFDGSQAITIPTTAIDVSKATAGVLPLARGGTGNATGKAQSVSVPRVTETTQYDPPINTLEVREFTKESTDLPNPDYHHIYTSKGSDTAYACQIAVGMRSTYPGLYYREKSAGTWADWKHVYSTGYKPTAADVGAVPTTRTVNNKALSSNISLTASDVGALAATGTAANASKVAHTLTFTGAVSKTFNGSTDVSVAIPTVSYPVTSVNSKTGAVSLTKADVGLGNVPNVTTNNQTPTFTQAATRANLVSGETLSTSLGKIMKWFSDLEAFWTPKVTDISQHVKNGYTQITKVENAWVTQLGPLVLIDLQTTNANSDISSGFTSPFLPPPLEHEPFGFANRYLWNTSIGAAGTVGVQINGRLIMRLNANSGHISAHITYLTSDPSYVIPAASTVKPEASDEEDEDLEIH